MQLSLGGVVNEGRYLLVSGLSYTTPLLKYGPVRNGFMNLATKWTTSRIESATGGELKRAQLVTLARFLERAKNTEVGDNDKLVNIFGNAMTTGYVKRQKIFEESGFYPPWLLVISPSMACNLNCIGCYYGNYQKSPSLDFETLDRIVNEGKEMGIYFYVITGGEPFISVVRKDLFTLYKKHKDAYFQIYTNGTFIDENVAKTLAELGNAVPAISVEGFREQTDARRGEGVFDKVLRAMNHLRAHKVRFGISVTYTSKNAEIVSSDEFIDFFIDKGASFGWYFYFVPVGKDDDLSLMASPEQRVRVGRAVERFLAEKPIFVKDFWNGGACTNGCMAGGKLYAHINHQGYMEPCVFTHFSVDNIKDKSLRECLDSKFFRMIRSHQEPAYRENPLRPCIIIDRPDVLRECVEKAGAKPTHPGAEAVITKHAKGLDDIARRYAVLANNEWERREHELQEQGYIEWGEVVEKI